MVRIERIDGGFSVYKAASLSDIDLSQEFCFVGKTDEELSVVCRTEDVPEYTLEREDGWSAFRIQGALDFSLIGILAKISAVLAEQGIGIFVVSTYNTDYVLVKTVNFEQALHALEQAGYVVFLLLSH